MLILTNTNDTLYLDLNTDTTATTGLPAGKYTMLGDFEYFEDFTPMSIIPAFEFEGSSYGSWFFNKVSERPLAQGEMNVSLNETQYTIGFALTDYNGIKVNGTYSGPAVFNDYSEQMEVIANSSAAKIPGVKHRRTFGLFK